MPSIQCVRFDIGEGAAPSVEREVAENGGRYCDDAAGIVVSSIEEALELLRWQEPSTTYFTGRFRIDDLPSLTIVWQQVAPTAALAYQLRQGKVEIVHMILGGLDPADESVAIDLARRMFGNAIPHDGIPVTRPADHVLYVAFDLRHIESEEEPADILGFIAIVPIFCELCGIE